MRALRGRFRRVGLRWRLAGWVAVVTLVCTGIAFFATYRGTGTQVVFQPLSNFALLSQDQDLTALVSAGGGVKIKLASRLVLRLEVHDFLTPFPKQVITPAANAKVSGWLQDIVPMAGLGFAF